MASDRYEILEEELDPNYEPSREEILEKLRVYLDFDYSNDVIQGLYNFEENRDMYIEAVYKVLVNDRKAGEL